MNPTSSCADPVPLATLLAYWLDELDEAQEGMVDEHLLGCDHCSASLQPLVDTAGEIRAAVRGGEVRAVLTDAFVNKLAAQNVRLREYRVEHNGSVNCTVAPEYEVLVTRLRAPLAGIERLDVDFLDADGQEHPAPPRCTFRPRRRRGGDHPADPGRARDAGDDGPVPALRHGLAVGRTPRQRVRAAPHPPPRVTASNVESAPARRQRAEDIHQLPNAWVHEAVRRIERDFQRSADTHLVLVEAAGLPQVPLYLKDESTHPDRQPEAPLGPLAVPLWLCNGWIREGTPIIEASSGSTAVSEAYFARC